MDTHILIEAVKSFPALYIKDQPSETLTISQKNMAWNQISLKVNQPIEKCKAKWRNLRDSYQRAIKSKEMLKQLGKVSDFHLYKHEAALSFLENKQKRKISGDRERSKRQKVEHHEAVSCGDNQDNYTAAVEYLIESEQNENRCEKDEELEEVQTLVSNNVVSQEYNLSQNEDVEKNFEGIQAVKNNSDETNEQTYINYELATDIETASSHDELYYQESFPFVNESHNENSLLLDSWLSGIKDTIMSFPKLLRARVKKEINDLVSDYEIRYLESIETDQQSSQQ